MIFPFSLPEQAQMLSKEYPHVPDVWIWTAAILMTVTGLSMVMILAVTCAVCLEVITEFLVYRAKYNLTYRQWVTKSGRKIAGYLALALLASCLSWVLIEIRSAVDIGIPNWMILISPNAVGSWIISAATLIILDNCKRLGVPLPPIIDKWFMDHWGSRVE